MRTPQDCGEFAESVIQDYCFMCECATPEDIRKAGEMLISKMARGIEKYAGNDQAIDVLKRTLLHISKVGGAV